MQNLTSNKVFTVSQLTYSIKSLLEKNFLNISVQGEISNFKSQASGHFYFSLKDASSQLSAVLFKGNAKSLSQIPKDGDKVVLFGELSVYPPRGSYQIIVRKLSFVGLGELLLKLQELKNELKQKGWLDLKHKKKLPLLPKKIGIITSPTGAVIQDILNVLQRRFSNINLILNPVKVQGEGAKEEIAQAIYDFNKYNLVDVIILGRGGGSLEDLWAFNEEIVAKAIFESKIPIISAVGHETDVSISDFIADVRAPTPSAAAEIVIKEKEAILESLNNYKLQISKNLTNQLKTYKIKLSSYKNHPLFSSPYMLLGNKMQMIDDMKQSMLSAIKMKLIKQKELLLVLSKQLSTFNPISQIEKFKIELNTYKQRVLTTYQNYFDIKKERFTKLISHLKAIDPKNLLKKGYSILFNEKTSSIILSTKDIAEGEEISAILDDGKILAKTKKVIKK